MNATDIQKQVLLLPRVQQIQVDSTTKKAVIKEWLQPTIDEIAAAYEWDFAMGETTFSGGTVADQSQYVLKGDDTNALEIITIKYDDDNNVLKKMHPIDVDAFLHNRTHSVTDIWVPDGRVNGFPRIKLVATPTTASKQILYRFRKNDVALNEMPGDFARLVALGVARNLDENLDILYQNTLEFWIDNYRATQVNERVAHLDPLQVAKNNWAASKVGWSG